MVTCFEFTTPTKVHHNQHENGVEIFTHFVFPVRKIPPKDSLLNTCINQTPVLAHKVSSNPAQLGKEMHSQIYLKTTRECVSSLDTLAQSLGQISFCHGSFCTEPVFIHHSLTQSSLLGFQQNHASTQFATPMRAH